MRIVIRFLWLIALSACSASPVQEATDTEEFRGALLANDPVRNIGQILQGKAIEEHFELRNRSNRTLTLESIEMSRPGMTMQVPNTIGAGQVVDASLKWDTAMLQGSIEGVVKLNTAPPHSETVRVTVSASVIPPIEFVPRRVFFVAATVGQPKTATVDIVNHRESPLMLTAATASSERFAVRVETLEEGKHYRLTLSTLENAQAGESRDRIVLQTKPPHDPPLAIPVFLRIRDRVYSFPASVDMGALPIAVATDENAVKGLAQTLMVYRPGTDDFELEASIDLDFIDLRSERGREGDRYQLTLALIPDRVTPGPIEGTVRIETNDRELPLLEVPVSGYVLE